MRVQLYNMHYHAFSYTLPFVEFAIPCRLLSLPYTHPFVEFAIPCYLLSLSYSAVLSCPILRYLTMCKACRSYTTSAVNCAWHRNVEGLSRCLFGFLSGCGQPSMVDIRWGIVRATASPAVYELSVLWIECPSW